MARLKNTVMCAKCNKVVDKFKMERNEASHEIVFTAYCHNKVQCVRLRKSDLAQTTRLGVLQAFLEPK